MPTLIVRAGENGIVLPNVKTTEIIQGETVVLQAYPDSGYRVKNVVVNGMDKGSLKKIRLGNFSNDTTVEVVFAKNMVNKMSMAVLENGVEPGKKLHAKNGITVSFSVGFPEEPVSANMAVILYNASNSLRFGLNHDGSAYSSFTTVNPAGPSKLENQQVTGRLECQMLYVTMHLYGEVVTILVKDQDGFSVLAHTGKLFYGDGAMLSDGWLVTVDGSVAGDYDYPFDIQDFSVVADGKRPVTMVGNRKESSAIQELMN